MSRRVGQKSAQVRGRQISRTDPRWSKLSRALEGIHPFVSVEPPSEGDDPRPLVAIQLTTRCNQRCPFCQAPDPGAMEDPQPTVLGRAFDRVATALPDAKIILTGGEPCLRSDLPGLVGRLLADDRVGQVEVQTNATRIGRHPDRFTFEPSPRLLFVVGLHGLNEPIYDACTRTNDLLPQALDGVRALLAAGHRVEFNCVATASNVDHLGAYVERLAALFPESGRPAVHFSIMGIPEHRPAADLLVPFEKLLPALARARSAAQRLEVDVRVSLSAGHAAVPACMLAAAEAMDHQPPMQYHHEGPTEDADRWWHQGPTCKDCRHVHRCLGLPSAYAERFGFEALVPIPGEPG